METIFGRLTDTEFGAMLFKAMVKRVEMSLEKHDTIIPAIKLVRDETGCDLPDAKALVEVLNEKMIVEVNIKLDNKSFRYLKYYLEDNHISYEMVPKVV